MAVRITIKFDRRLFGNPAIQRTLWNAAKMVRDLWLSRAPHVSGDYVDGLRHPGSIAIRPGVIEVTNFSEHAQVYEFGHKAFNWGLKMLEKGGAKVKTAKDGSKYRIIKVDPAARASFRKPSVGAAVITAFKATVPRGRGKFKAYSGSADIGKYHQHVRLGKAIKAKPPLASGMSGFFVVSEKAIKADPKKWFHDKMPGFKLAASVQREAAPIIKEAIAQALSAELARKARS